jgi:hypothetical protein
MDTIEFTKLDENMQETISLYAYMNNCTIEDFLRLFWVIVLDTHFRYLLDSEMTKSFYTIFCEMGYKLVI